MSSSSPPEDKPLARADVLAIHPIQLDFVAVRELTITTNAPPSREYVLPEGQVVLGGGVSPFDDSTRKFQVSTTAAIGDPNFLNPAIPLYLFVGLVGGFTVHDPSISHEQIQGWAMRGAQLVMIPYLREHVAGLTGRAGFSPVLIPLIQMPTTVPTAVEAGKPSESEIAFAKARGYLQQRLTPVLDEVIRPLGFTLKSRSGRLEGPGGYINPSTIRDQVIRSTSIFEDKSSRTLEIMFAIGHDDKWKPVIHILTSFGPAHEIRSDLPISELDAAVEKFRNHLFQILSRLGK